MRYVVILLLAGAAEVGVLTVLSPGRPPSLRTCGWPAQPAGDHRPAAALKALPGASLRGRRVTRPRDVSSTHRHSDADGSGPVDSTAVALHLAQLRANVDGEDEDDPDDTPALTPRRFCTEVQRELDLASDQLAELARLPNDEGISWDSIRCGRDPGREMDLLKSLVYGTDETYLDTAQRIVATALHRCDEHRLARASPAWAALLEGSCGWGHDEKMREFPFDVLGVLAGTKAPTGGLWEASIAPLLQQVAEAALAKQVREGASRGG